MPQYAVTWRATARGSFTVEAADREEAEDKAFFEIHNVEELDDFEVIDVEWFQA
jgi:hypothetical protein